MKTYGNTLGNTHQMGNKGIINLKIRIWDGKMLSSFRF